MSFTPRKYKDIFDEMRAMTTVVTDFEVGSVARTMYESFAYEMALLYEKMQLVYLSAYVDTATGNQLDQVVAVLGIQRSQPDYAEGTVSFQRDGAGQEIVIPTGTLVATQESSTGEKKVYSTSKEAVLGATKTIVEVTVRGIDRGEEFETAADTIVVMPRPVPGIKFVNNDNPIRLVGKRRETDDELRERAKNALISSGKASAIAIENALLSLSGVRDARVKEDFQYARGMVDITNNFTVSATIPAGAIVIVPLSGDDYFLRTLDPVVFTNSDTVGTVKSVRVEQTYEGKLGEYTDTLPLACTFEAVSNTDFTVSLTTQLLLAAVVDYHEQVKGLIEVYVDSPRLHDGSAEEKAAELARLTAEVERVRAAGIFSIVKPSGRITVTAVFRIDISAIDLTAEERREFEESMEEIITNFMNQLRMGENMLYGKLIKEILNVTNVENVSDFRGTVTRGEVPFEVVTDFGYSDSDKFIAVDTFARVRPRHICVATEDKELKVNVAYQATGLDALTADNVRAQLNNYFNALALGDAAESALIEQAVVAGGAAFVASTLELRADTWAPGPADDPRELFEAVTGGVQTLTTYVERPVLGILFGYADTLDIAGAVKLIMPLNVTQADQLTARAGVVDALDDLFGKLGPEESITFEAIKAAAETVAGVLAAEVEADDFVALLAGLPQPTQVSGTKIEVLPFQRAFRTFIAVTATTEKLFLSLTAITVEMALTSTAGEQAAVQAAVSNAFNNVLAGYEAGDDIAFMDVKGALENLVVGVPYTIAALEIAAHSEADGRDQASTLAIPADLHVRTIELPLVTSTSASDISLSLV